MDKLKGMQKYSEYTFGTHMVETIMRMLKQQAKKDRLILIEQSPDDIHSLRLTIYVKGYQPYSDYDCFD